MEIEPEEEFADDPGEQVYQPDDVTLERGVITTPYDAPVRTLLDEIKEKVLIVNPPFQRRSVWKPDRQSKLIESLLLNIPIPVLYFAEDEDGSRVVVDGQQRLRAIEEFHAGAYYLQKLEVLAQLNKSRWADLTPKQSRTILSRTMRCVVISSSSPATLRFEMFERLNTGGIPLNDQELRNCVFRGDLNDLLEVLARTKEWLAAVRRPESDKRMRDHEMALRFLAISEVLDDYRPPLKLVLNDFMRARRILQKQERDRLQARFMRALGNVRTVFGSEAFRRAKGSVDENEWESNINRAVFDVQMLGFMDAEPDSVQARAEKLLRNFRRLCDEDYNFISAISASTAGRSALYDRLRIWGKSLAEEGLEPGFLQRLPAR